MADVQASTDSNAAVQRPVLVKLVLLGEAAVGKSSVVLRFVQNDFQENKEPTIGAAFLTQKCRLEDKVIKFEIWDTAGQERFHSLAPMYYRNAAAAVIVSDVTSSSSFDKAKSWIKELQRQANPNIVIALINNKVDLVQGSTESEAAQSDSNGSDEDEDSEADDATATPSARKKTSTFGGNSGKQERQISKEEASAYAQEHGLLFFETSAKTGEGVVEVFTEIAKKIPLDQYAGRAGGPGSRTASGRNAQAGQQTAGRGDGRVNLNANEADKKDGCAC